VQLVVSPVGLGVGDPFPGSVTHPARRREIRRTRAMNPKCLLMGSMLQASRSKNLCTGRKGMVRGVVICRIHFISESPDSRDAGRDVTKRDEGIIKNGRGNQKKS
jgi:hypothetical protein